MLSALVGRAGRLHPAGTTNQNTYTRPLQYDGLRVVRLLRCQLFFPRANIPRDPSGSCMTFSDLALEVHLILGYKLVIGQLRLKRREIRFHLLKVE